MPGHLGELTQVMDADLVEALATEDPLILTAPPDGFYLSALGYGRLRDRSIEPWVTVTWANGTTARAELKRPASFGTSRRWPSVRGPPIPVCKFVPRSASRWPRA